MVYEEILLFTERCDMYMTVLFQVIGVITTFYGCVLLFIRLYVFLKKVYMKQRKIKCLCKHEYINDFKWIHKNYEDITLKCRKCGKRKKITIWKQEDEVIE